MSKYTAEQVRACILAYKNGDLNYCRSGIIELLTEYAAILDAEGDGGAAGEVPPAIVELNECRRRGWNDSAPAYRAGWNDCRSAAIATRPQPARSGVVSDDARDAERYRAMEGYWKAVDLHPDRELGEGVAHIFMLPKGSDMWPGNWGKTIDAAIKSQGESNV